MLSDKYSAMQTSLDFHLYTRFKKINQIILVGGCSMLDM